MLTSSRTVSRRRLWLRSTRWRSVTRRMPTRTMTAGSRATTFRMRYMTRTSTPSRGRRDPDSTREWVNIGIAEPLPRSLDDFTTEQLWSATIDPMLFGGLDVTHTATRLVRATGAGDFGGPGGLARTCRPSWSRST